MRQFTSSTPRQRATSCLHRVLDSIDNFICHLSAFCQALSEPLGNFLSCLVQLAVRILFAAFPLIFINAKNGIETWQLADTEYLWFMAAYGVYLFGVGKFFRS